MHVFSPASLYAAPLALFPSERRGVWKSLRVGREWEHGYEYMQVSGAISGTRCGCVLMSCGCCRICVQYFCVLVQIRFGVLCAFPGIPRPMRPRAPGRPLDRLGVVAVKTEGLQEEVVE